MRDVPGPGATWTLVWIKGLTETWRVEGAVVAGGTVAVKVARDAEGVASLDAEAARLEWLASVDLGRRIVAPTVVATDGLDPQDPREPCGWLVTTWLDGARLSEPVVLSRPHDVLAEAAGGALAAIHRMVSVDTCPFTATPAALAAAADTALSEADPENLPDPLGGSTVERARDWVAEHTPAEPTDEDRVVTHGDPALPNLLVDRADGATGLVDWTGLAVGDRHRDLAVLVRSFIANLGPEHAWRLLDAYGLERPDPVRLEWYVVIDQLVGR